jgi:inorganic pyrophosphatase
LGSFDTLINMKVFIENESGSNKKNLYNEKNFKYKKTVIVSKKYPYPYGFILNTTNKDGDNLDCFVITDKKLKTGEIIDVEPIGLMEQTEDRDVDNNILAILPDELIEITDEIKQKLIDFVTHVFDHIDGKTVTVGNFFGKHRAVKEIKDLSN